MPPIKTVAFGELLLRLSPPGVERFVQASAFEARHGGAEANVAASLAQWGIESHFVSKLPAHEIGQAAVDALRRHGVRTDHLVRGGDRVGLYFLETGVAQRPSRVVYDRAGSAVTTLRPGEIDWESVLEGAAWFHWSGITPALGDGPRAVLGEAIAAARARGVTVSVDLNYRATLWSEADAQAVMRPLVAGADVCIGSEGAAAEALGVRLGGDAGDRAERLAGHLRESFGIGTVALTVREDLPAGRHGWSGVVSGARTAPVRSARYEIATVGRVGGGDAFAAGLIYGLLTKTTAAGDADARAALEFATAAACLKHTIPGDVNLSTVDEVERLIGGDATGRIVL